MARTSRARNRAHGDKYVRMASNLYDIESIHTIIFHGEFDPGSGRTLAACLIHASRAGLVVRHWSFVIRATIKSNIFVEVTKQGLRKPERRATNDELRDQRRTGE
jgi:hypothetical protein